MSANHYTRPQNLFREFTKATNHIKKAARQKTALFLMLAATGIASILNPQQTTAQTDTIWGNGIITTAGTSKSAPVTPNYRLGNVTLFFTPDTSSHLPDTTYKMKSNGNGFADFTLPISISSTTTGIGHPDATNNGLQIWPNPANGFNVRVTVSGQAIEKITIYDLQGRRIKTYIPENKTNHTFTSLKDQPNGTYVYAIKLNNGETLTGKFRKTNKEAAPINNPIIDNKEKPLTNNNLKAGKEIKTAAYWIKWEKKGYYTDSTKKTIAAKLDWSQRFTLTLKPLPPDTLVGNVLILTYDSATNDHLRDVTLYIRPDKSSKLPDTTYIMKTDYGGWLDLTLPVSIKSSAKTALYWFKWEKEGYYTDSLLDTIKASAKLEWDNNILNLYLKPVPPPPAGVIKFVSTARDLDSLIAYDNKGDSIPAPLKGVIAYLIDFNKNKVIGIDTTNENGEFTFDSIPQNIETVFLIGNKKGYYSFGGIHYITPGNIKPGTDSTIRDVFNTALPRIRITKEGKAVPADYIADQNLCGTVMGAMIVDSAAGGATVIPDTTGEIKYQFTKNGDREYTKEEKEWIRKTIQEFVKGEGNIYKIVEVNKLPRDKNGQLRTGILISPGSNATTPGQIAYYTLLGKSNPTIWAKMHLSSTGGLNGIAHEMKRALGFGETSYTNSVMDSQAKVYTETDKEIGKLSRKYHQYEHRIMPHTPKNIIITNPNLNCIRAKAYTVTKR